MSLLWSILRHALTSPRRVAVVERKNVPLVTIQLLIEAGASAEETEKAGLANMTASLLTKGTKRRTATQIAEQIEFLGGSISSAAGWNDSKVTINVMSDKLDQAMAILADVVINPSFKQTEIDLLKSQTLDNLAYNLTQPGFLANYAAASYSFDEHPTGGTPKSISAITRVDIVDFHKSGYQPYSSVLIFTGDITAAGANQLAGKYFGNWGVKRGGEIIMKGTASPVLLPSSLLGMKAPNNTDSKPENIRRILVVDLPDAGQAAVKYLKPFNVGRIAGDPSETAAPPREAVSCAGV